MRHVFVLATARTGGTWFGKVLDTSLLVKYVWEPDSHRRLYGDRFRQWPHDDPEAMRKVVREFKSHLQIRPSFPKKRIEIAVYKLYSVMGDVSFNIDAWTDEFLKIREKLNGKIVHLVRHPARWTASVARWGDRPLRTCLELYGAGNRALLERCRDEKWYRLVLHEDATRMSNLIFASIFHFCRIPYGREFWRFREEMHSRDENPDPIEHPTIMTQDTVLERWRELGEEDLAIANEMTVKYWDGIYEPLGGEKGRIACV